MEERLALAEDTSLQLAQEVEVLKQALALKKSRADDGPYDSNSVQMLHQLAKVRCTCHAAYQFSHALVSKKRLSCSYLLHIEPGGEHWPGAAAG